jgi:hypothetical protein
MPQLIASALAPYIPGVIAGTTITYATVAAYAIYTAGTMWALKQLAPDVPTPSSPDLSNRLQPDSPKQVIYGRTRVGGAVTYIESVDNNSNLLQVICIAGHPVEEIEDIYVNDTRVTKANVGGGATIGGAVDSADWKSGSNTVIDVFKGNGSNNTTALADLYTLTDNSTDVNSTDFTGNDTSFLFTNFEYNREVFTNGIPTINAVVKGRKIYDPRKDSTSDAYDSGLGVSTHRKTDDTTWEYSNNPALCILDYLTQEHGLNVDYDEIDDTEWATEADICEEQVTEYSEGEDVWVNDRYNLNGVFTRDMAPQEIIPAMLSSCSGSLFYAQGKWVLRVGKYRTPISPVFDEDDLRGPMSIDTKTSRRDIYNSVTGKVSAEYDFTDPNTTGLIDFIPTDYPMVTSSVLEAEDGGVRNTLELPLPFTTELLQAQRIAKQTLFRSREQIVVNARFGLKAFQARVGDNIKLTNSRMGWNEKVFEIVSWKFAYGEGAALEVDLTLKENSSDAYDWNAEASVFTTNNTTLPRYNYAPTPTLGTPTTEVIIQSDGTTTANAEVAWTVTDDAYVNDYVLEWKRSGETDYQSVVTTNLYYRIAGLQVGQGYDIRVSSRNRLGVRSVFAATTLTVSGDTTAPSAPTMGSATGSFNQIKVSWTNPSDDDFKEAIVFRNTTNNSASATEIARISGDTYVDAGLPDSTTYHYWVKAVDFTGNVSGFSSTADATTNASSIGDDGDDGQNARGYVMTNQSHTVPSGANGVVDSYAGSGTDIEIYDGHSKLTYTTGSLSNGYFTILSTTVSPSSAITVGAASYITNGVRIADHSVMSSSEDTVTITYEINGRNYAGSTFTFDITQTITKSSAGSAGAGRWNIPVTSLPTTSAEAQTAWDASSVGRDEVESDQAWFYTGTEANPTAQSVWIYDSGTSTWNEQDEVIDGSLLVTGTVTSDAVDTNFIDAFEIDAANITTGLLEADRIQIDGVTLDTVTTGVAPNEITKLIIAGAGVATAQIATNAVTRTAATAIGSTFTTTSNTSVDIAALSFTEDAAYDLYAWASGDVENDSGSTKEIAFQLENTANSPFAKQIVNLADGDTAHLSLMGYTTTANGSNSIAFTMTCVGGADLIFSQPFHFFVLGIKR